MSPDERLALTLSAIEDNTQALLSGPPEVVDRRFALLRSQNDERNRNILRHLGLLKDGYE
jgi:hypothetical protein